MMNLCADGGGTKLQLLVFDENYRLMAHLRGPAVTAMYIDKELVDKNMRETLQALVNALPAQAPRAADGRLVFEKAYITSLNRSLLDDLLPQIAVIKNTVFLGEGEAGLLASAAEKNGAVALAGTGSDYFYLEDGRVTCVVGGYGPVLGDECSGYDIGRRTLDAAIRASEQRGPATLLEEYVRQDYGIEGRMFELVSIVHGSPDTRKPVARATYTLARAIRDGDAVAAQILTRVGIEAAENMVALLCRVGQTADCELTVSGCGGAWKIHPLFWQSYAEKIRTVFPKMKLQVPLFDPVMGGVVYRWIGEKGPLDRQDIAYLQAEFAPCALKSYFEEPDIQ